MRDVIVFHHAESHKEEHSTGVYLKGPSSKYRQHVLERCPGAVRLSDMIVSDYMQITEVITKLGTVVGLLVVRQTFEAVRCTYELRPPPRAC